MRVRCGAPVYVAVLLGEVAKLRHAFLSSKRERWTLDPLFKGDLTMGGRIKPIIGAVLTGGIVTYFAGEYLFIPAMPEPAFEPLLGTIAQRVVYWVAVICFFDWAVQKTGKTMLTAMVIAISQILLVDFNYVLAGRRDIEPALYSVGILFVVWAAVAFVYDKLSETS